MESAFFTVADWVANPRSNSIRRKNRRSVLPPRLMDLLFYFAQHPMEVVSRQEIIDNCWDRDVVTDQAITQAIFELRKFLKDGRSAKEAPEYIKTVPKRGYRLLAPVHQLTVEEYIAATSEVIDDEDVAAERELQQPVSAAEPEHEAATSFESKILEETGTAALEQIPSRSASIKQERRGKVTPPPAQKGGA
ncbi:winged helix-turn-helix domain-containing protein, partial [Sutterella wadsworthensis]|uniref:winged helix-turn-helix domain-containing protein n=2 Tax=Sutterella wadsworthensis TaxID=40545 RepID=UPI003AF8BE76